MLIIFLWHCKVLGKLWVPKCDNTETDILSTNLFDFLRKCIGKVINRCFFFIFLQKKRKSFLLNQKFCDYSISGLILSNFWRCFCNLSQMFYWTPERKSYSSSSGIFEFSQAKYQTVKIYFVYWRRFFRILLKKLKLWSTMTKHPKKHWNILFLGLVKYWL